MKSAILILLIFLCLGIRAQDSTLQNTASQIIVSDKKLSIRGYAQIDFNQPYSDETRYNAKAEVHRMIVFLGYKFDDDLQFVSEIEIEHANEIFLEQAFVNYRFSQAVQFRGGLLLIPMGIINEYHEPTLFNGVERPNIDKYIVPSTWREMGLGLTGILGSSGFRYQAFLVNGFRSHNGTLGLIGGSSGLRGGRQKGIKSTISSPNVSLKLDYFGIPNLKIGLAYYGGKTQSDLYDDISLDDELIIAKADSSVVGIRMIGLDARYNFRGFEARGQYIINNISNTTEYNSLTGNVLGSRMNGYLVELAFDVLSLKKDNARFALLPFVRYEDYNTQAALEDTSTESQNATKEITAGLTLRKDRSVSFKLDHQWIDMAGGNDRNIFNAGIGIWF